MSTNAQLQQQISELLAAWNEREAQFRAWLAGTPNGGPNGDGKYPLTDASGVTQLVDCPAKLADTVGGPAALSTDAKLLSEAARDTAITARDAAVNSQTVVTSLHGETITNRNLAQMYRDDAAAIAAGINMDRTAVEAARDATLAARDAAAVSEGNALASANEAITARDGALVARNEAQVARDQAEAFAASINPATLVTVSALQAELDALVGAVPGTLNTLQELAAALGNDPNFATTITSQLAGKANLSHTHVIADVLGLQTALDGKQPVGSYAQQVHGHVIGDISGLQSALDGKAALSHTHTIAQVTGLQSALDGKAALSHTHNIADVTGLQGQLDLRARLDGAFFTGTVSVPSSLTVRAEGVEGGQIIIQKGSGSGLGGDVFIDQLGNILRLFVADGAGFPQFHFDFPANTIRMPSGHEVWHGGNFDPNSKANTSHTHTIGNVTGLQAALDAKANVAGQEFIGTLSVVPGSGNAVILSTDGAIEIVKAGGGPYIDFKDSLGEDFDVRLQTSGTRLSLGASGVGMAGVAYPDGTLGLHVGKAAQAQMFVVDRFGIMGNNLYFADGSFRYAGNGYGYGWAQSGDNGNNLRLLFVGNNTAGANAVAPGPFEAINLNPEQGVITFNFGNQYLRSGAPTMWWQDTDHRPFAIHVNSNLAYFMRGASADNPNWTALGNGAWPMVLALETGDLTVGGALTFDGGSKRALAETSPQRPGVTRLYRRDDNNQYNVQTRWSGSRWILEGYFEDTYHAPCAVGYADQAGVIDNTADNVIVAAGTTATNDVWSGPIEIREVNRVANANLGSEYAPALTFHWSMTAATALKMFADGSLRVTSQSSSVGYRNFWAEQIRSSGGLVPRHGNTGYNSAVITVSTANPSGGNDGDIWFKV